MTTTTPTPNQAPIPTGLATPQSRPPIDARRDIPNTVHSEIIKFTSLRSVAMIGGLNIAVSFASTWAFATYLIQPGMGAIDAMTAPAMFTAIFAALSGILMFASEAQHGTLAPLLVAQPSRAVVAIAKAFSAALLGFIFAVTGMLAGFVGPLIAGAPVGETSGVLAAVGWAWLFTVMASMLGLGVGMVARHSAAAISGLLIWWLIGETIMSAFLEQRHARFMPFRAGLALVDASTSGGDVAESLQLTMTENALVFSAYVIVALTLGTLVLKKVETA